MKEIDDALRAGMTALFHVRPPSGVRKISAVAMPLLLTGTTHAIRGESEVILKTRILSPEGPSGVTSLQLIPPSIVYSSPLSPESLSIQTAQPVCASTIRIVTRGVASPARVCAGM